MVLLVQTKRNPSLFLRLPLIRETTSLALGFGFSDKLQELKTRGPAKKLQLLWVLDIEQVPRATKARWVIIGKVGEFPGLSKLHVVVGFGFVGEVGYSIGVFLRKCAWDS
jgi:hypothetical protein